MHECKPLDGGAVEVVQGTATFQRVDFIDNSPSTGYNGGAVDLSGLSTATFTDCNFTRNSAPAYQGRAVRVDPIKSMLKAPGTKRLKLICAILLSTSAFKFNLRRYIKAAACE
jgi:hypothetical protein